MNSISVGEILRNNISNKNRLDIIVRLLYVECKYNENSYGVELYQKMQRIRMPRHFAKGMYEPKFNTLIDSFSKSGFIKDNPIILNANKKLVNGSHRLACCIYFNCDEITYIVEDKNPKYEFTWFKKNFSDDELEIILNRYNEILDRYPATSDWRKLGQYSRSPNSEPKTDLILGTGSQNQISLKTHGKGGARLMSAKANERRVI